MRVGVFGGAFDPIHHGHLVIAEQCREQVRLDEVWFVPTATPPHKGAVTPFDRRAEMVRLAIAGHPNFRVNELENDRPGPSFTADTLDHLHCLHPGIEWHLLIGSDCLPDLPGWHEPQRILARAKLVVAERPGWPVWPAERLRAALRLPEDVAISVQCVPVPLVDLASRDLRRRVAEGRSIRYLVPRAVEVYITEKGIYR
jgi:nicotinate-nucleotide adenylyltransferase